MFTNKGLFAAAVVSAMLVTAEALPAIADSKAPALWRVSCFVYRDNNRNGIYDMADRPYAGMPVELERPDGTTIIRKSNLAGFANFNVGFARGKDAQIVEPGSHKVRAIAPQGTVAVVGEAMQTLDVQRREDVGGGMVLASACRHMGVQNELRISGRINGDASGVAVLAVHENGRQLETRSQADGSFSLDVDNGKWKLTLSGTKGSVTRFVEVNGHAVRLSAIDITSPSPPPVSGATKILDFDTLTSSDTLYEIPSGYMGLNFRLWVATHHKLYKGSGYINATTSGEFIAYNSSGYPAEIWSDQPFDFIGTFVGLAWPRGEEQDVIVKAWRNGKLVHEDRFGALNSTSIWFDADYRGIDRLEFSHGNYERVVIDDLRVRTAQ